MSELAVTQSSAPHGPLQFLWLEITQRCNLACSHCYTSSSPTSKDPQLVDWTSALRQASDLGCTRVQFIGGEPTVHRRLEEYLRLAAALGYRQIEVYTNLVSLPESLLTCMAEVGACIATSFYSNSRKVHDQITRTEGSFDKTVSNLNRVARKSLPIRVGVIEMKENSGTLDGAIGFLSSVGVSPDNVTVDYMRAVGRATERTDVGCEQPKLCGNCWNGKLAVSWNGDCYPCVFARDVLLGNVLRSGLAEIVQGPRLSEFRQANFAESMLRRFQGLQTAPQH